MKGNTFTSIQNNVGYEEYKYFIYQNVYKKLPVEGSTRQREAKKSRAGEEESTDLPVPNLKYFQL